MAHPLPRTIGFASPYPDPIDLDRSKQSTILAQAEYFQRAIRQEPIVKIGRHFNLGPLQYERTALRNPVGPRGPILHGAPVIQHDLQGP